MGFGCGYDKAGTIASIIPAAEGNFAYLFLEISLEKESVVRARDVEGITKNRSHLAGLNGLFKRFAEVGVVEGRGRVKE